MLITPHPGADRNRILTVLREVHTNAGNLRGTSRSAFEYLLKYLRWATDSARLLRNQVSRKDIDRLIFTPRYQALLSSCGTLAGTAQEGLVNGLVDLELEERCQAFEEADTEFTKLMRRWIGRETFVVADSSFYIHNPAPIDTADLHQILCLVPNEDIRLLFPIAVVDELDGLKDSGKQPARWRSSYTLGLLDRTLRGETVGVLRHADRGGEPALWRGELSVEIVLDQPGHVRLPITDDEIIDRAVAIKALSGCEVRLLTCDTGQHTRGRAAGLMVTKVPAKDPGPEPDWDALNKPGNGGRARRRAKQAEVEGDERPPEETA